MQLLKISVGCHKLLLRPLQFVDIQEARQMCPRTEKNTFDVKQMLHAAKSTTVHHI